MSIEAVDIVNAATLEKVILSQRVAGFLNAEHTDEERTAIENVARFLAQDISLQVRESLSFELRICKRLPHDIAAKIAVDVESVSTPFLASTEVFSDTQLAGLVPHLEDHAQVTLARRSDIGPNTCHAIVTVGDEKSVSFLIRNEQVSLFDESYMTVTKRFSGNQDMLDRLSCRVDLPISVVEELAQQVTEEYKRLLVKTYDLGSDVAEKVSDVSQASVVAKQIENASAEQIHAYVIDLRKTGRLNTETVLAMAKRGYLSFLESMLALEAGLTLAAIRDALYSADVKDYIWVMQQANVSQFDAKEYRKVVVEQAGFKRH